MECDAICNLVSKVPILLNAYIRCIVLDDDTKIRTNLKEELGKKSKGKLEACISSVRIIANPSHHKRAYQKHMYKFDRWC